MAMLQRDLRASDRDREQVVVQLKAHYADGRLAHHELAARSDAAYKAVWVRELQWLLSDLPREVRRRRHRPPPVALVPLAILILAVTAWLVTVPPEVTVAMVLIFLVFATLAAVLLSPIWIPVLLAFVAYRVIRSRAVWR
jgi:hypothetical protein